VNASNPHADAVPTVELASVHDGADTGRGSLTFIGTATVLYRVAGFTFLTDPNFLHRGDHAKLGYGLRSRRLTEPAITIGDLPPLDFILLSHHHGDHFDDIAAEELPSTSPIVTTPHAAATLRRQHFTAPVPLRTWERHAYRRGDFTLTLTALPGTHAPGVLRRLLPPVMGTMVEVRKNGGLLVSLYITGDTLMYDGIHQIAARYPNIDVCVIHLGGTRIAGVLLTMDDRQGVELLQTVRPGITVPIHYDDYTVFKSPLEAFRRRVASVPHVSEVVYLNRGDTYEFPLDRHIS
jgi:L-ascorbate metabolism protein UlaG (beta-lactamase superfamily)